jgi:hypothetical protein
MEGSLFLGKKGGPDRWGMIKPMKHSTTEYDAFKDLLSRIMTVPHSEIVKREAEYQKQLALNPNKRGPKPKRKRGAGRAPAV